MLEYAFERVPGGGLFVTEFTNHREAIQRRAAEGWRYAGCIPARQSGHGVIMELDLIFEREQGGQA
ncbi:DUF4177 domain-containing protein [Oscillospiraceae bacterium 38-13]